MSRITTWINSALRSLGHRRRGERRLPGITEKVRPSEPFNPGEAVLVSRYKNHDMDDDAELLAAPTGDTQPDLQIVKDPARDGNPRDGFDPYNTSGFASAKK